MKELVEKLWRISGELVENWKRKRRDLMVIGGELVEIFIMINSIK